MIEYRGYLIEDDTDRHGNPVTIIISPNGDEWHASEDPEGEIDQILEWQESLEETYERNDDWRKRQWELI